MLTEFIGFIWRWVTADYVLEAPPYFLLVATIRIPHPHCQVLEVRQLISLEGSRSLLDVMSQKDGDSWRHSPLANCSAVMLRQGSLRKRQALFDNGMIAISPSVSGIQISFQITVMGGQLLIALLDSLLLYWICHFHFGNCICLFPWETPSFSIRTHTK